MNTPIVGRTLRHHRTYAHYQALAEQAARDQARERWRRDYDEAHREAIYRAERVPPFPVVDPPLVPTLPGPVAIVFAIGIGIVLGTGLYLACGGHL